MTTSARGDAPTTAPSAGQAHLQRFVDYMKTFTNEPKRRTARHYPRLASRPWHDAHRFEIVARLEANYPAIRREISRVDRPTFRPENESIPRSGSWDVLMLFEHGRKNEETCKQCPVTAALLMDNPAPITPEGLIYFSRMAPGTHVAAHYGPTNIRLRCHLGIQVPAGDCGIRVGHEVRTWEEGRCLVFDDHYEHEAWNHTTQDRVVLIVDIWHPELSDREIALLWALDNYALSHARRMARRARANCTATAQ
jgi:aspartyl/asparaginyl beta-hydroxylase (cupin superfamily)